MDYSAPVSGRIPLLENFSENFSGGQACRAGLSLFRLAPGLPGGPTETVVEPADLVR